jgi:hypothetical protein
MARTEHDELAQMRASDVAETMGIILAMRPGPSRRALALAKLRTGVALQAYHIGIIECWECVFIPPGDPCWRCTPYTPGSGG